jgi:cytochrome c oxidase cbb3-type subunit 2
MWLSIAARDDAMATRIATVLPALITLLLAAGTARAQEVGDAQQGKIVYERYCVLCHGEKGDGKGHFSQDTTPVPRDFRQGTFKWRSTPSGSLPTDADLEKVLITGLYGTSMSSLLTTLSHQQRLDVVAYIKTFSPRFATEKPQPSIIIPPEPPYTPESVKRGAAVYEKFNCAQCHGDGAEGDGPSADDLLDDWGNPIVPYDLTEGHIKCGNSGPDIYRVFIGGLNGTPMPSFADSISPDEAWDLVHFIQSLSPGYPKNLTGAPPKPTARALDETMSRTQSRLSSTITTTSSAMCRS